ncbi:MAG: hypothetical protein M0Z65_06850 [Firmicutes bacterium]|uniref:Uncharacterized protein n=1 Tax=Melghirimyces thermohalophilus TaxID=1236220 RepID=A0A1G6K895_9BACL|nr:hypothetical protein [Melghirimyces thermohalophilus]MDA8352899.1 hypothetical protein [Bacillota bacterium]SDC27279.1 hypothetical protein SAMN04488112_105123 [Melghirimyces thermohalophilus]
MRKNWTKGFISICLFSILAIGWLLIHPSTQGNPTEVTAAQHILEDDLPGSG